MAGMRRLVRVALSVLGLVILAGLLAIGALAWQIDRLGRQDEARPSDAIVVLGARVEADGRPGSDLTSRTLHGVDLWQAGYAPWIICTGGFKNERLSAAAVCKRYAVQLGVPATQVFLADGGNSTAEDALAAARVMREHGWRTAILVSHPLHLFRSRWLFTRAGIDAVTSPTTTETDRIVLPLRLWYVLREEGAMVITSMDEVGWFPQEWKLRLQALSHALP